MFGTAVRQSSVYGCTYIVAWCAVPMHACMHAAALPLLLQHSSFVRPLADVGENSLANPGPTSSDHDSRCLIAHNVRQAEARTRLACNHKSMVSPFPSRASSRRDRAHALHIRTSVHTSSLASGTLCLPTAIGDVKHDLGHSELAAVLAPIWHTHRTTRCGKGIAMPLSWQGC